MQAVRRAAQAAALSSLLFGAAPAEAACNRPDLQFAVPPDDAVVAPNAKLHARYKSNAEYTGEDITVTDMASGAEQVLTGDWNSAETLLSVTPKLEPGQSYSVEWPRLRGINSANLGRGKSITFAVGASLDQETPQFTGLKALEWDVDRERDDCTDNLEERYVFDFDLGAASDDGGRESLMIAVFQTQGPHIKSSAPEPISVQRLPAAGKPLRLTRTINDGEGDVCFAAVTRDLTGKVSASGAQEVCTTTVAPPFFNGCTTSQSRRGSGLSLFAVLLAAAAWSRRGRR